MMEILLANRMGFCFGVRRAIELAEDALRAGRTVSALGPLVHNPQETGRLDAAGIHSADHPGDIRGDTVVIRAHGARPETYAELGARNLNIIDATCPFVAKSQRIAGEFAQLGYTLIIVGHPDHPEVQGILGYTTTPAYVVSRPEEVAALPEDIRPGVIAQTTVNEVTFLEVVQAIARRYPGYTVQNTVCSATRERQESARRLASQVDAILVIGGRRSSNTNRLAEICRQACAQTFLIETADEIVPETLQGIQRVGITAGASTPDWLIDRVVERLRQIELPAGEQARSGKPPNPA